MGWRWAIPSRVVPPLLDPYQTTPCRTKPYQSVPNYRTKPYQSLAIVGPAANLGQKIRCGEDGMASQDSHSHHHLYHHLIMIMIMIINITNNGRSTVDFKLLQRFSVALFGKSLAHIRLFYFSVRAFNEWGMDFESKHSTSDCSFQEIQGDMRLD